MTHYLEDALRAELHAATADAHHLPVDPDDVIAQGRRALRYRAGRRALAAMAVVAVAVGGVVAAHGARLAVSPPAHRATGFGTVSFTGLDKPLGDSAPTGARTLRVAVAAGRVTYTLIAADGSATSVTGPTPSPEQTTWRTLKAFPNVAVGLAPATATHLTDVGVPVSNGASVFDTKRVPGTEYQAFVSLYSSTLNVLHGFLWVDPRGTAHTTDLAAPAYSTAFTGSSGERWLLVTVPDWDWLGLFGPGQVASTRISEASGPFSTGIPRLESAHAVGTTMQVNTVGLLPVGATKVRPAFGTGDVPGPVQVTTLTDDTGRPSPYAGFFTETMVDRSRPGPWMTALTWTDHSGKQHDNWVH